MCESVWFDRKETERKGLSEKEDTEGEDMNSLQKRRRKRIWS